MKSSQKGNIFLAIVLILAVASGFVYSKTKYQYGLDIQGGVRLTYRMKTEELAKKPTASELMVMQSNLTGILGNRVASSLGVVEGTVQPKGEDAVIIELPGYTDAAEARKILSNTASIKLYHARNVVTEQSKYRKYTIADKSTTGSNPEVSFSIGSSGKTIKVGDPEYKEMISGWDLILEGSDLTNAEGVVVGDGAQPQFFFSSAGGEKLYQWSVRFNNAGENLAFVLDGKVLSINPKANGSLLRETAVLQGTYDAGYVNSLCNLLKAGALPVSLEDTSNQTVDPTIGKTALSQMVMAGAISFGIITLFLIYYYAFPGFIAFIALGLYMLFTLTVMKLMNATFSLAAIAGFILSVGMAVDANILVFERMKEEMRDSARSHMTAVELGFKRALSAIIDSNICTIITSAVLVSLGSGPVKGFATSLIIGVLISLFTAVTVTRSLLVFFIGNDIVKSDKLVLPKRGWFFEKLEDNAEGTPLNVVGKSKMYFLISILTIIPGLIFIFMGGIKPNVEFSGGYEATYKAGTQSKSEIESNLEKNGFKGSNVKFVSIGADKYVSITVPPNAEFKAGDPEAYSKIAEKAGGLAKMDNENISSVGPSVQKEALVNAVKAVVLSSVLIVFFLSVRFGLAVGGLKNGLKFGLSAILALVHDIFVVVGVAAIVGKLLGWEVSSLSVTALLTVIGFSVHDTIVIFDRIRENLRRPVKGENFQHLCDKSISQSIARSLNTSMTVIITLAILMGFGSATIDLKFFALTMLVGIVSGTYSSIFNATPILYLWDKMVEKSKGVEHTLIYEATAEMNRLRAQAMARKCTRLLTVGRIRKVCTTFLGRFVSNGRTLI
ncbi:MAG: protein translocase subunit SecD [Armatimonadetes bacterium]|nr:protein translocase subunit SecD [Armatimonadota bacterium]